MTQTSIEYGFLGFRLEPRQKRLTGPDGEPITLSSRSFDVLCLLVEQPGEILSRETLMEAVWPQAYVEENNLTQAISTIRKALNDTATESQFIRTLPGRGYCFIAPVAKHETSLPTGAASADRRFGVLGRHHVWRLAVSVAAGLVILLAVVWFVRPAPTAVTPSPLGVSTIPEPESRIGNSVAVLPLEALGANEDPRFIEGLHAEIITQLTQNPRLNVIARSSVVALVEEGLSVVDIARTLRVESLLSGTIRLAGEQARVSLQLVDVATGVTLWSGAYDVDQQDLAALPSLQDDIALNVASALTAELAPRVHDDFTEVPEELLDAYRYTRAAHNAHDRQDYAEEWRLARSALELDPDFPDALHSFAAANLALLGDPLPGMSRSEHAKVALDHANRLGELAPARSDTYALKAAAFAASGKWGEAASAIAAAEAMGAPLANLEYAALVEMTLGHFERAAAIYEATLDSELINPYARGFLMVALELAGRRDESREKYATGEDLHTQWWGDNVNVLLALGRNEAVAVDAELVGVSAELHALLVRADNAASVHKAVAAYRSKATQREAIYYAALAARHGEHEAAVELLRVATQDAWNTLFLAWLPVFDMTRREEGFKQLLRDAGLVAYWQQQGWPQTCSAQGDDFACGWSAYAQDDAAR
jgi:DNA-binding winged helix-turn-helix (wHTH) protein/TolB-like protein